MHVENYFFAVLNIATYLMILSNSSDLIVAVVNVKEEPGTNNVSTSVGVGSVGVPSGMMSSAASSSVSTTGFAPMEFQTTRSKCFM